MTLDELIEKACELRRNHAMAGRAKVEIREYIDRWEHKTHNPEEIKIERLTSTTTVYLTIEP